MNKWLMMLIVFLALVGAFVVLFAGAAVIAVLMESGNSQTTESVSSVESPYARDIQLYVDPIDLRNIELRERAAHIVQDCPSNDKTCHVHTIYRYVVENYKYYADPRKDQIVQLPNETITVGGGDCEDMTILLNSLLENIGIETYVVLTPDHAYSLACGVDPAALSEFARSSLIEQRGKDWGKGESAFVVKNGVIYFMSEQSETVNLVPNGGYYYWGYDGSDIELPYVRADVEYSVDSSEAIDSYVMTGPDQASLLGQGSEFIHYPSCARSGVFSTKVVCPNMMKRGIFLMQNNGGSAARVTYAVKFSFEYSSDDALRDVLTSGEVQSYNLNNATCVVLDATNGVYGYAGLDTHIVNASSKIALNTQTHEWVELQT